MKNKAILIMDMPDNCHNCPIIDYCHNNDGKSNLLIRQVWCPLSPLPEPISLRQYVDNAALDMDSILAYQYAQGYNDCLEEIKINKEET